MNGASRAADCEIRPFGTLPDGRGVEAITLSNRHGLSATVITYGASLQALVMPDRAGRRADIALGHSQITGYLTSRDFMGATVGRYANRIAAGRIVLDGKVFTLTANEGKNALHGGAAGLDRVLWSIADATSVGVTLRYVSVDGEEGYPGTLAVTATYALSDTNALTIEYRATTDKPTIVNITNHAYFNLGGEGSDQGAMGHLLTIAGDAYTPVDRALIPTGEIRSVTGTPFDFRKPTAIGARIREVEDAQIVIGRGYDHNWVLSRQRTAAPRVIARLEDPSSGRTLELVSDQPGLQFYSGNFLDGRLIGKAGYAYRQGDAIVLEPQLFPDTPNRTDFGSARLEPGEEYVNRIVYRLSVSK